MQEPVLSPRPGLEKAVAAAGLALTALALALHLGSDERGALEKPFYLGAPAEAGAPGLLVRYDPAGRDLRFLVLPERGPSPEAAAAMLEPDAACLPLRLASPWSRRDWPELGFELALWAPAPGELARSLAGRGAAVGGLAPYGRALLALEALALPRSERPVALLPGAPNKKNVFVTDEGLLRSLKERWLRPDPGPSGRLTVEVLNASGKEGLALKVTDELRKTGLDVVYWGTAGVSLEQTQLFDRQGDRRAALELRRGLDLDLPVVTELQSWPRAEATLLLGADWRP